MSGAVLAAILTSVAAVLGSIGSLWAVRSNHAKGVREQDMHAEASVHEIRSALIKDVREINHDLNGRIDELSAELKDVKTQLAGLRGRYSSALDTLRSLVRWARDIREHLPESAPALPEIPTEIRDEL